MANTTNFGWETPDDTDLVKDGALAMRTLGNAIDTSFVDLKGGTTGQNLRKNSNTDLDFIWAGDATNTVIDAEGDLLVGDSADTLQRLAIGTTGQVLTVDTAIDGKVKWAALPASGKILQVVNATTATSAASTSTTYADTNLTASITPSSTSSKILILFSQAYDVVSATSGIGIKLLRGSTTILSMGEFYGYVASGAELIGGHISASYVDSPNTTSSTTYKTQFNSRIAGNTVRVNYLDMYSTMTLMEIGA